MDSPILSATEGTSPPHIIVASSSEWVSSAQEVPKELLWVLLEDVSQHKK